MKRALIGGVAGYVVWTVLWLGGNAGIAAAYAEQQEAFAAGGDYTQVAPLLLALALSVVCSAAAGVTCARLARSRTAVLWMAIALLLTGIGVQAGVWARMPLWYHLPFLALLVPVCLAAGRPRAADRLTA